MSLKQSYLANFNCTFGAKHEPLLEHFFEIVYPAFYDEYSLKEKNSKKIILEDLQLSRVRGEFMLTGILVKRATLEVKSKYVDGKLVQTDEKYKSDPFSYFIINLQNHRMILVKNQNGSPTLSNFSQFANQTLKRYIRLHNKNKENDMLPNVHLNIVAIPFNKKISEELKRVEKITKLTLRFYPLNNDIIENDTVQSLLDTLDEVESNSGSITYNSPKDIDAVGSIIKDTKGTMKPTVNVRYRDGSKGTLSDDSFTEVMPIDVGESDVLGENIDKIVGKVISKAEFAEVSEENKKLYEKFYSKLEAFFNKSKK